MARKKQTEVKEIVEKIIPVDYCDEMSSSFVDYALSVITARAIPDVRDGLKPIHRRILWGMHTLGVRPNTPYKKSARIIGEVMGKYHPHGDASIYDAMVRMGQDWVSGYPLVDGHGNFGSVEGDQAAASRYSEARLSKVAEDIMLANLSEATVDFVPNYDGTETEPELIPNVIPNILLSGTEGIAVGLACKMPTHNLGDIVDVTVAALENPALTNEELAEILKGPDWATGGIVVNKSDLPEIYRTGAGRIRVRGRVEVEPAGGGRTNIVVTEIPVTMIGSIDTFMNTVADLSRSKVMPDVTDIKNLSGRDGIRIIIELKKGADVDQNINILYKKAKLEDTFGYNATLLLGVHPQQMSLSTILQEFLAFYRETLRRKYEALLAKEQKNAEVKEGLLTAADCIDTIIEMLRGSKNVADAKRCLMEGVTDGIAFKTKAAREQASQFEFSEVQADAILAMRLQSLIGLEIDALTKDLQKSLKNIAGYISLLSSKAKMSNKMKSEMLEIKEKYAKPRKTDIIDAEAVVIKKQEIKPEQMYAMINRFGYIKLIDEATFERNKENAVNDYRFIRPVMNVGRLFAVTDANKCYQIKAASIPVEKYNGKGVPVETLSGMTDNENLLCVFAEEDAKKKLLFVTARGLVKQVKISELITSRRAIDATKLNEGDSLVGVHFVEKDGILLLKTKNGIGLAFGIDGISLQKRNAAGVTGLKLSDKDVITETGLYPDAASTPDYDKFAGKRGSRGK